MPFRFPSFSGRRPPGKNGLLYFFGEKSRTGQMQATSMAFKVCSHRSGVDGDLERCDAFSVLCFGTAVWFMRSQVGREIWQPGFRDSKRRIALAVGVGLLDAVGHAGALKSSHRLLISERLNLCHRIARAGACE
jgi:hypothetical protein